MQFEPHPSQLLSLRENQGLGNGTERGAVGQFESEELPSGAEAPRFQKACAAWLKSRPFKAVVGLRAISGSKGHRAVTHLSCGGQRDAG
jgi:hypothetical protein